MKSRSGFTVIELVVTVAVIALLLAISVLAFTKQQTEARDQTRFSRATIVATALEKYYQANGEYPSVPALVSESGNSGSTIATKLKVNTDVLTLPGSTSSVTNFLTNTTQSSTKVKYTASSVDPTENIACQSSATGGCDKFTLTYKKEEDGSDVVISSQFSDRAAIVTPPSSPPPPAPDPPSQLTMSTSYAAGTITATASIATCTGGANPQYATSARTNNGIWGAYSAWSTSRVATAPTDDGVLYGFRAKATCVLGGQTSAESVPSAEVTYLQPITTPSAPSPYVTASFRPNYNGNICIDANGQGGVDTVIQIWACNSSAAQDWSYNSNDQTLRPTYNMGLCIEYLGKGVQLRLKTCSGANTQRWARYDDGTFHSISSGYCVDATSFGTANGTTITPWDCNGATAQIWNPQDPQVAWNWSDYACPVGTSVEYRRNDQTTNIADSGWLAIGGVSQYIRTTLNQGYTYTTQLQTRCYNSNTTSAWSATGQSSIAKAVLQPGAPTGWSFWKNDANRYNMNWGWNFTLTCGAGTNRYFIEDEWINGPGNPVYWLSPRQPNGVGTVGWWTADSTSGAPYFVFGPNATMQTTASYAGAAPATAGLSVSGRAQGYCQNPVTGRGSTYGPWGQGWGNL